MLNHTQKYGRAYEFTASTQPVTWRHQRSKTTARQPAAWRHPRSETIANGQLVKNLPFGPAIFGPMTLLDQWVFGPMTHFFGPMVFGPMTRLDQCVFGPMGFRTNGPSDQWGFGPKGRRTNGLSDHRDVPHPNKFG